MFGSFVTRGLIMVLGYIYPAYDCFKSLEHGRAKGDQLRFWCQYWVIMAVITAGEKVADPFVGWLPLYCEAKLALIVYLWHPRTKGASHVYRDYLLPFVLHHEPEVDRRLAEFRCRSTDVIARYWSNGIALGQRILMEGLQYVAAQAPANQLQSGYGAAAPTQQHRPILEQIPSDTDGWSPGPGEGGRLRGRSSLREEELYDCDQRPYRSSERGESGPGVPVPRTYGCSQEDLEFEFEDYNMVDSEPLSDGRRRHNFGSDQSAEYGARSEESNGYMGKLRSATARKRSDTVPPQKKGGRH